MSSLLSLPTLLVLMFFPTTEEWVLFFCDPSRCVTQYTTSAFTSAKTKGMSYFSCRSPSLMALTGAGPQQKTPAGSGAAVTARAWQDVVAVGGDPAVPGARGGTEHLRGARRTFALLLGRWVQRLPPIVAGCQVRTGHPGLHPAVEVPAKGGQDVGSSASPAPTGLRKGQTLPRGWAAGVPPCRSPDHVPGAPVLLPGLAQVAVNDQVAVGVVG